MRTARVVILLAVLGLGFAATGVAGTGGSFPAAGVDVISHALTVGLYSVRDDGSLGALLETLEFKGRMTIERGDPYLDLR